MAPTKGKSLGVSTGVRKLKVKRKGIVSKKKTSKLKSSKNYKKLSRGQG